MGGDLTYVIILGILSQYLHQPYVENPNEYYLITFDSVQLLEYEARWYLVFVMSACYTYTDGTDEDQVTTEIILVE